jgi:hypothetical protein
LEDIVEKWPDQCVAMGEKIGCLTKDAAEFLGLTSDVEVIQVLTHSLLLTNSLTHSKNHREVLMPTLG